MWLYGDKQWLPLGLENLEKRETFSSQKKSRNFAKTGKVMEFYPKYRKNQKKIILENWIKYWSSQGNLLASNSENPVNMISYFKFQKTLRSTGKL